mmetsp:Transcript_19710/g.29615  ORF Transcript_19710/g.29615 Transcript_19710/m.29615 type:complete len:512 (+) Transcript_19710:21-1556(+)
MIEMLNDCVVNTLSWLAGLLIALVCLPFVFVGFLIFSVFFAAPFFYFITRPKIYGEGKEKLYEKYREEGVRLRGVVVKRWTSTSEQTRHHIKVMYKIQEEKYIKDLQVSSTAYHQTRLDLMVLPLYPRSAILLEEAEKAGSISDASWFGTGWSFFWVCGFNIGLVHSMVNPSVRDAWLAWTIVACEVVVAWIMGYFMARAAGNYELRDYLFGAKIVDSSNNIQARKPKITYQEIFPSSNNTLCSIIWMIITDYAKLFGFAFIFVYCLVFGGGYLLMRPFLIDCKMKQIFANYKAKGIHLRGDVISQIASNRVRLQYDAPNDSLSTVQRYEKILTLSCVKYRYHPETSTISDNPRIIVLKDTPTSAQLADEIDIREKRYGTGLYGTGCGQIFATIILFAAQTAYECFVFGGLAFPDIPTSVFALICVALQIALGCVSTFLHFRYSLSGILHNAKKVSVGENKATNSEDNIELATLPLDDSDRFTNATGPISLKSNEDDCTLSDVAAIGRTIS